MDDELSPVTENPWAALRRLTPARIALGRSGGSLPTREVLDFQLAHARARDAVHLPFDAAGLAATIAADGREVLRVQSAAGSRSTYLQRPDLGRRLAPQSRASLQPYAAGGEYDAAFVVADGLSALAVHAHAAPLLRLVADALVAEGWLLAPVVLAEQGRVALGDEVGELLGAAMVAVLIGERPGLSAADSLGVYLTYAPRVGRSDAERNCLSNIRPAGLGYDDAARRLLYLMREARRLRLSGVELKDDSDMPPTLERGGD